MADSVICVILSRRDTPPAFLASLKSELCVFPLRAVFVLELLMLKLFLFFSSFPFSISIWTSFVSSCVFLMGYSAVSSISVSAATRLAYEMCLDTYVR